MKNGLIPGILILLLASIAGGTMLVTPWHQIDPEEAKLDTQPPGVPGFSLLSIERGRLPRRTEDGSVLATGMDDFGFIRFRVDPPADDRSAAGDIGYIFHRIDGDLPDNMSLYSSGMRAIREPAEIYGLEADADSVSVLKLHWFDGVKVRQDDFSFRVCVRAIDLGGNVGEPSDTLRVAHDGSVPRY